MSRKNLESYLLWLISPQSDDECEKFRDLIDSHCELVSKIPTLTDEDLVAEINIQLEPYDLQVDSQRMGFESITLVATNK